ncbi:hypothetical protein ACLIBG_11160 [Virgibacillus sp. W0181]|uniref:hypothetical protein n=1 Tax=Virgibacillus sp. W0181 TaxID=3391581 RepID=UPI003F487A80
MNKKYFFTLKEIVRQNNRRMYYYAFELNVRLHEHHEPDKLVVIWNINEAFRLDDHPLATYFNYAVRHHVLNRKNLIQKA